MRSRPRRWFRAWLRDFRDALARWWLEIRLDWGGSLPCCPGWPDSVGADFQCRDCEHDHRGGPRSPSEG